MEFLVFCYYVFSQIWNSNYESHRAEQIILNGVILKRFLYYSTLVHIYTLILTVFFSCLEVFHDFQLEFAPLEHNFLVASKHSEKKQLWERLLL